MTAANEGIGYLLISAGSAMQMGLAFAGLVVVGAMAMIMYELFQLRGAAHHGLGAPGVAERVSQLGHPAPTWDSAARFPPYGMLKMSIGRKGTSMAIKDTQTRTSKATEHGVPANDHLPRWEKLRNNYRALIEANGEHLVIALEMLGGDKVFARPPQSLLDVHHWVSRGIPSASIFHLAHAVEPLPSQLLSEALGVSLRTLHRKKSVQGDTLSVAQGGRTFKFAEMVAKATLGLGSREAAVQWLTSPAMGLNQQRPVDLLATPMGTQLVEELLDRIEYGVYA